MPGNQDPATPWPSPYVLARRHRGPNRFIAPGLGRNCLAASTSAHHGEGSRHARSPEQRSTGRTPNGELAPRRIRRLGVDFHRRGEILDEQLDVWRQVWTTSPVAFHGRHYDFEDVWVEPKATRPGGPVLWFGGSTVHDAVARRLAKYGSGFNPLGRPSDQELRALDDALAAEGRSRAEIEMVGGIRGRFVDANSVASLDEALEGVREQLANGYSSICFRPSMFTDDRDGVKNVCERVVGFLSGNARYLTRVV